MGRHRKPTKLKLEHSKLRKDRDVLDVEGQDLGEIEVPSLLDPKAMDYYIDLAIKVKSMNILMEIDCYYLSILANDMYEYEQIVKEMSNDDQEYLVKDSNGNVRRNPLLIAKNKLAESIKDTGKRYGLGAIERAGLPIEVKKAQNQVDGSGKDQVSRFQDKWSSL